MFSRAQVGDFIDSPKVQNAIMALILFNAVLLGLDTSKTIMARVGPLIDFLDRACLAVFIAEIVAKLYARGLRFFRDPWSVFDFLVISISLVPASQSFTALRSLRILRLFRVISVAPSLKRVVEGFLSALPGMGSVFLLMGLIFYVGAVVSTNLFGDTFPQWFGTLGRSAYSLFQVMTLESWSMGIVRPIMEVHGWSWAFFVPFILLTTFAVTNLLVGLIVNSMQDAHSEEEIAATDQYREEIITRLEKIERMLAKKNKAE